MSLPIEVRNDATIRKWAKLPLGETDTMYADEVWERKPHPNDVEPIKQVDETIPGTYYGEWVDKTELAKAKIEAYEADLEVEKAEATKARAEARAKEKERKDGILTLHNIIKPRTLIPNGTTSKKSGCQ